MIIYGPPVFDHCTEYTVSFKPVLAPRFQVAKLFIMDLKDLQACTCTCRLRMRQRSNPIFVQDRSKCSSCEYLHQWYTCPNVPTILTKKIIELFLEGLQTPDHITKHCVTFKLCTKCYLVSWVIKNLSPISKFMCPSRC